MVVFLLFFFTNQGKLDSLSFQAQNIRNSSSKKETCHQHNAFYIISWIVSTSFQSCVLMNSPPCRDFFLNGNEL